MPRSDVVLSIFVASPSDTEDERQRLEEVVDEINNTWSRGTGIRLELVKWETHALPGVGADAQDVINRQIDDDYDIFIGIMWQRFGTPTHRYESGTAEEFYRAKARHDSDPDSVHVMFYFKDAPVAPSRIDFAQMALVQEFRRSLPSVGTLFWTFDDVTHFEKLVRIHLQRVIQDWQGRPAERLPVPAVGEVLATVTVNEEEERGVLDYIIEFTDRFEDATNAMASTNSLMEHATATLSRRGQELAGLTAHGGPADYKGAKRIITTIANELNEFESEFKSQSDSTLANFEAGV